MESWGQCSQKQMSDVLVLICSTIIIIFDIGEYESPKPTVGRVQTDQSLWKNRKVRKYRPSFPQRLAQSKMLEGWKPQAWCTYCLLMH